MRLFAIPLACLALTTPARADTLIATRPSLGCVSLKALAELILPDGSSRIGTPKERPGDAGLKIAGACINIPAGAAATLKTYWRNTASVAFDPNDGTGPHDITVPTINFEIVFTNPGQQSAPQ